MDPRFPHLADATTYPTSDARAYPVFRNRFDYTRWDADTRIQLLSVNWDNDGNAVDWASREQRDQWFQAQAEAGDAVSLSLDSPARMIDRTIKLPLPYDMTGLWNYVHVTLPVATSAAQPLDYEGTNTSGAVLEWFFFIEGFQYRSPSCTEITLDVDWWTTFLPAIRIQSVQLTRGHWAVAHSADVDAFLKDPMACTENLMDAEGDNLSVSRQTRTKNSVAWNTGEQRIVWDMGAVNPAGDWTAETPGGKSFYVGNQNPTGYLFSIRTQDAGTFVDNAPIGFWQAVKSMWIIPLRFLSLDTGNTFTLGGVTCTPVFGGLAASEDVTLQRADWDLPASAGDLTKLYTGQYSRVRIVRGDGAAVDIPPEQLGSRVTLEQRLHIADDGARMVTWLNGNGYDGTPSTMRLQLITARDTPWSGAWQDTVMQHGIPCYQVQQNPDDYYEWQRHYQRANDRARAKAVYDNALASADTARTNTNASADTAYTNTVQAAQTSYDNQVFSLQAAEDAVWNQNQVNSAYRRQDRTQSYRILDNSMHQQVQTLGLTLDGSPTNINTYRVEGTYDKSLTGSVLWKTAADGHAAFAEYTAMQDLAIATQKDRLRVNTMVSAANNFIGNQFGGSGNTVATTEDGTSYNVSGSSGSSASGSNNLILAGVEHQARATGSALQFGVTTIGSIANINITEDNNLASRAIQARYLTGQETMTPDFDTAVGTGSTTGTISIATHSSIYQNHVQRASAIAGTQINQANLDGRTAFNSQVNIFDQGNSITVARAIAGNTLHNQIGGSKVAYATGDEQTVNLPTVGDDTQENDINATLRTMSTANAGTLTGTAPRARDTTKANADRTRTTTRENAKRTYDASLATVQAGADSDGRGASIALARYAETGVYSQRPQGVQIQVQRPSDGDLLRVADRMNRYGYTCHRRIDSPQLGQMTAWTYWECAEVWIASQKAAPNQAVDSIKARLMNGVTVWENPAQVGEPQDNERKING